MDAIGIVVDDCEVIEDRLRLAREYRLAKAEAVALTDMAELKLLQGDLPAAERAIEESLSRHGQTVYARTQRIRGRILLARRRCAEAIESLEKGLAAARASRAIEEQALIGFELAQALAEDGDLAKAREQLEAAEATTLLDPALNLMARAFTRGALFTPGPRSRTKPTAAWGKASRFFKPSATLTARPSAMRPSAYCGSLNSGTSRPAPTWKRPAARSPGSAR